MCNSLIAVVEVMAGMVTSQGSSELILRHNDSQLLKFACSEWNNERMTMNYVIFYVFSALCRIRAFYYRFSDGRNGVCYQSGKGNRFFLSDQ